MSIASSAVLVELNISVWTANKIDRGATDEVHTTHGAASGSARVHKNLMAGTNKRKAIADFAAKIRQYHLTPTLPWSDKGPRVLPTSAFMDYKQSMNVYRSNYEGLCQNFFDNYSSLIDLAKHHMGSLFNPNDYPPLEDVKRKFGFNLVFTPIPESGDFRLDIPAEDQAALATQYEESFNTRLADAMREPWNRLHTMLSDMSKKLVEDEEGTPTQKRTRFHDTFVTNPQNLCSILTHLNITKDPKLEEARRALEITMLSVDIDSIKESQAVRSAVKSKVDAILEKFDW
jgi:hypothetical protein